MVSSALFPMPLTPLFSCHLPLSLNHHLLFDFCSLPLSLPLLLLFFLSVSSLSPQASLTLAVASFNHFVCHCFPLSLSIYLSPYLSLRVSSALNLSLPVSSLTFSICRPDVMWETTSVTSGATPLFFIAIVVLGR